MIDMEGVFLLDFPTSQTEAGFTEVWFNLRTCFAASCLVLIVHSPRRVQDTMRSPAELEIRSASAEDAPRIIVVQNAAIIVLAFICLSRSVNCD